MPVSSPVQDTIDTLFRRESGRLISVLVRLLGPQNLGLAEDVMQEAFVAALRDWSSHGVPDNPPAWLLVAACVYFGLDTSVTVGAAADAARALIGGMQ